MTCLAVPLLVLSKCLNLHRPLGISMRLGVETKALPEWLGRGVGKAGADVGGHPGVGGPPSLTTAVGCFGPTDEEALVLCHLMRRADSLEKA